MGANIISEPERTGGETADDSKAILESIRMIVRALRVSSRLCEGASELSGAQIFVLRQLRSEGRLSINELAERTFTHQSTVSGVVGRLVDGGYVGRSQSKEDGRRFDLALTAKGLRALAAVPKTAQEVLARTIGSMAPAQRRILAVLLQDLTEEAGFTQDRPPLFFED